MAKTKRLQQQKQQQPQLLMVIYLTICFVVVALFMKVDSVSGSNIPLDGSGNILQQQQQQQQHEIDNCAQEHNFIMDPAKQNNSDDEDDEAMKSNVDLMQNELGFGQPFKSIDIVKRAPAGFVGMRGKKFDGDNDSSNENFNENDLSNHLPWYQWHNSGEFFDWNNYAKPNVRRYKKASNAFYGVRGKKFVAMNDINSNNNNNNNRWHDFLQQLEEERVREAILQDFVERLAGTKPEMTAASNDMTKRAPTGFTGVRGKRPFFDDELDNAMDSLSKRGLGNNAFIGVRGKKDVAHQTVKRSPAGPESYPGRNGKRQRFADFNNKFVAVRGKKSSYNDMSVLNAISNNDELLDTENFSTSDKRAPKGFQGMRGKRPFTSDDN